VLAELLNDLASGRSKQFLIWRVLNYRRAQFYLFARGGYHPLASEGERAGNIVAFARVLDDQIVVALAPRLVLSLTKASNALPLGDSIWGNTRVRLPDGSQGMTWQNVFTGETVGIEHGQPPGTLNVAAALQKFPVALLVGGRK
jgi:maltooligosyltrehalose synthase